MYSFKVNADNDLEFDGQGNLLLVDGPDETAQQINRQLSTRLGEWFLNTGIGLDWDILFAKPYSAQSVEQEIRRAIMDIDSVSDVPTLELDHENSERELQVRFIVTLEDGENVEGVVELG